VPDPDYAGPDSFTFQVVDDSGAPYGFKVDPTPNTLNFNMTEINDVPELDLNGADPGTSNAITFAENQLATLLAPNSTLTDPDALDYENGTLTVEIVAGGSFDDNLIVPSEEGALLVGDQVVGYVSGGYGEPLVVTFTDQATVAIVEMVVKSISFANYSDDPAEGLRTIEYVLTDGAGGTAATVTATVDVTASEDGAIAFDDDVGTGDSVALEGSVFAENGGGMDYDPDGPAPVVTEVNGIAADVGSEILLASGAKLTINADGTFSYDPNHVFEYLISFEKAAQTFTFTAARPPILSPTPSPAATPPPSPSTSMRWMARRRAAGDLNNNLLGTEGADLFVLTYLPNYTVSGLGGDDVFRFGGTFDASDQVDGGAGSDTILFEGDFLSSPLLLTPTTLANVEEIVLGGGFSYNIMSVNETVGAGAVLRVDGSALVAPDGLYFSGGAETDGRFELIGGAGNDVLIGGGGNDVMVGGRGSDIFDGRFGTDRVDYSQSAGMVNAGLVGGLAFHGAGVDQLFGIENLTGSAFDDVLTGNGLANVLDGAVGADVMIGLGGNDTYVVDNVGDVVTESDPLGGLDAVRSSVDHTLGDNVENLFPSGTANIKGTGNGQNNVLTGNSGNNLLSTSAGGADPCAAGSATTSMSSATPAISRSRPIRPAAPTRCAVPYRSPATISRSILTDGGHQRHRQRPQQQHITGNSGKNLLNGVGGVDSLRGGDGDDIYVVSDVGDTVIETNALAAGGNDLVRSSISFQIGANIEALQLTGSAAINGTGNGLDNVLTGNNAANTLNGGVGADLMSGGLGDDLYFVDNVGDQAIETSPGGGIDTVQAGASFTLGALVENLTLTGTAAINGTGNAMANTINGNGGDNVLDGGGGDDLINAGAGADTLWGGLGIDTLNASAGNDKVHGGLGNDILTSGSGVDELCFDTALSAFYNVDAITDFSSIGDNIYLDDLVFSALATGAPAAGAFRAGSAAPDADDRILYDAATGHILLRCRRRRRERGHPVPPQWRPPPSSRRRLHRLLITQIIVV
jgi:Ca2+-binding RTX toxin-like protein